MQPMEGSACTQSALIFFLFSFGGGGGGGFFSFFLCSLQVPNMFPRVFAMVPGFNPICFAQSPPLLTYLGGPKGEALCLSIESSILGSLHSFNFFFAMGQSNWLIAKKESWTCEAPPTN